jgi:hypothetical protein
VRELGASGQGALRHAVLLGTDDSGAALVSLFTGFGMSDFTTASRYVGADRPCTSQKAFRDQRTSADHRHCRPSNIGRLARQSRRYLGVCVHAGSRDSLAIIRMCARRRV